MTTNSRGETKSVSAVSVTWNRQNMFDPATIRKSITTGKRDKFKLLFGRSRYSYDVDEHASAIVRYKLMNGVAYILDVETKLNDVELESSEAKTKHANPQSRPNKPSRESK